MRGARLIASGSISTVLVGNQGVRAPAARRIYRSFAPDVSPLRLPPTRGAECPEVPRVPHIRGIGRRPRLGSGNLQPLGERRVGDTTDEPVLEQLGDAAGPRWLQLFGASSRQQEACFVVGL